ncbi:phospholipid-binding lipoprotein MlaA [Sphingorhabdus rigui]|uniref:Phospholipid-binding lipoprotein MlaA n=2 Tax=Sphingorhabdus rigui TaxID=1282858 RepID=A0A840AYK1_9SPHN|nr:phospholipid-binding lipoprotein MlaA [Sphingorhabdus rigui]
MSITSIIAIALLSGPSQLPPVVEPVVAMETAGAPTPAPEQATQATVQPSTDGAEVQPQSLDTQTPVGPVTPVAAEKDIIVVTANQGPPKGDPIAVVNEVSFGAVQSVDKAIIAPVAYGYRDGLPAPIRDGMHNVLNNLDEPVVFLNFLLQLKIGKAAETVGRFAINSTIGVAGLFDVAKKSPINLPRRPNGLADTLGYYGVGPGPYLFLPVFGSTTVRDLLGRLVDLSLLPAAVGKPFTNPIVSAAKGTLSSIDDRVENDVILTRVQESGNPYAAMREYYLKQRQAEIDVLKGKRSDANIDLNELEFLDSLPAPAKQPPAAKPQ